jgi:hypothetical protein
MFCNSRVAIGEMELLSPFLQRLHADWNTLRRDTPYPSRGDFEPLRFRYILGSISLIDVHREPLRFFYRLHGTDMARWLGFDLTGKFMDEAPNRDWARLACQHLTAVVESGQPSVAWHFDELVGDQLWNLEALVLPLSRSGHGLDMLISAVFHHKPNTIPELASPHSELQPLAD